MANVDEDAKIPYRSPKQAYASQASGSIGGFEHLLPDGFPMTVRGPATWTKTGAEQQESAWVLELTQDEITAIDQAVTSFQDSGMPLSKSVVDTFRLPDNLSRKLDTISEKCYSGLGFCVLRSLSTEERSLEAKAILFAGVSARLDSIGQWL